MGRPIARPLPTHVNRKQENEDIYYDMVPDS
jgi:hypothetical protein